MGFTLLVFLVVQFLSGVVVFSKVLESYEAGTFAVTIHRILPIVFVIILTAHILRAVCSAHVVGSASLKSGAAALFYFILTCGTGYILASSGEAAYWGSIISLFNFGAVVTQLAAALAASLRPVGYYASFDAAATPAAVYGTTAASPVVLVIVLLALHVGFAVLFSVSSAKHIRTTHEKSTVGGMSIRGSSRASLFSVVETRDLRSVVLILPLLLILVGVAWLTRAGNGI